MADGRRLVAIVFTDIVGYTQLSQTDEPAALRLLQEHDRLLRPILDIHGGRRVKSMGDGMLIEFPNALAAVECGVDFQRHVHERNARAGSPPLRLRIGIHVGDVQRRGSDILGDAVNIASRIEPLADPGGICLTEQAVDLVRHRVAYPLEGLGAKNLKGVREAVGVYRLVLPWTNAEVAGSLAPAHRLAILPLSNISPDPKDEFIADGLTEELISTISRVPELSVISRTSVMQYKNQAKRMSEIGRELNVRTVLEGSVRKSGSRVRIAVQLIDAGDDKHLWAENYDRSLEDIFTIQSEIAQEIANALQIRLLEEDRARIGKVPTADTEAYLLYLKGRYQSELVTKEGSMTAIGYFEEAVQRDPRFALAFAAIAAAYHRLGFLEMLPSAEASAKADVAASRALALDPGLAEGHIALAWVLFHGLDFRGAMREVRRALELNPNLSGAHVAAGQTLQYAGRFEEAFAEMEKALELDPLSAPTLREVAACYLYGGRPERAAELFRSAIEKEPENPFAVGQLGLCHVRQGRYDEGITEIRKAVELSSGTDPSKRMDLAYAFARAGRVDDARRVIAGMVEEHDRHGTGARAVAAAFASVGDAESAFVWLERAYQEESGYLGRISVDFGFEGLRSDPRFQDFLERLGHPSKAAID